MIAVVLLCAVLLNVAVALWNTQATALERSPLRTYAAHLPGDTCAVVEADLDRLAAAGLAGDVQRLRDRLTAWVGDLNLEGSPKCVFVALAPKARALTVWTFDRPVLLDGIKRSRYAQEGDIVTDNVDRNLAWAVDAQGRLIGAAPKDVRAALANERSGKPSVAFAALAAAAANVAPDAIGWAAGDFQTCGAHVVTALLAPDGSTPEIQRFHLELVGDARALRLRGRGTFADPGAVNGGWQAVRRLADHAVPLLPELDLGQLLAGQQPWHADGNDLVLDAHLDADRMIRVVQLAADEIDRKRGVRDKAVAAREYEETLQSMRSDLADDRRIGDVQAAIVRLKNNPLADERLTDLEREASASAKRAQVRKILQQMGTLTGPDDIDALCAALTSAMAADPEDANLQPGAAAAHQLASADKALRSADKLLAGKRTDDAYADLSTAANALAQDAAAAPWPDEPFRTHRDRLVKQALKLGTSLAEAYQESARAAQANAANSLKQGNAAAAEEANALARKRLKRAQETLVVQQRLGADVAGLQHAFKERLTEYERSGRRATSTRLRSEARSDVDVARAALKKAADDPRAVRPAQERVRAALDRFKQANDLYPDRAADGSADAEKLDATLERFIRPVVLDLQPGVQRLPEDRWKCQWSEWTIAATDAGLSLKADSRKPATLESLKAPWPAEFVLVMKFSLVDEAGRVKNNPFTTTAHPIIVSLLGEDGVSTNIALGHDAKAKTLGWQARVAFGGGPSRPFDLERNNGEVEPIQLTLRGVKGPDAGVLNLDINKQVIGTVRTAKRFHGLKIVATNPTVGVQPRFVAIQRLEVYWAGIEADRVPRR